MPDVIAGIDLAKAALRQGSWRVTGALGWLFFDIAVLWATLSALGAPPPFAAIVLGYLVGYLANSLPVPAGIGVLDAGLVGALVLYGVPATTATAGVLAYHTISFWVPGLGGALAYRWLQRRLVPTRGARQRPALEIS